MTTDQITTAAVDELQPHPENVRSNLGDLRTLTNSIASQGVLEPLLVREKDDTWQVIAGHRRLAAAKEAGLTQVPVIVRELTDEQAIATMLVENLQREDIDPLDEAKGYFRLVEFGWTQKKLAEEVGVSANTIRTRLRLLALPEKWAESHVDGDITADDVKELVDLMDRDEFDEDEALEKFPTAPRPRSLEQHLDMVAFQKERQEIIESLPEDEPLVEKESSGAYGGRRSLPRNHIFVKSDDLTYDEDGMDLDIDLLREHGNLGWYVDVRGYGDKRRVVKLAVCTDRGFYTRKSSPIPEEERPESAQKMIEEREQAKAERERKKELEQIRRQRILMTARDATKTELLEVVIDRGINLLSGKALRQTAMLFEVDQVSDNHEGKEVYDSHLTEEEVRSMSQNWRVQFLAAALMFERSNDELATGLMDEHAPFDEEEL